LHDAGQHTNDGAVSRGRASSVAARALRVDPLLALCVLALVAFPFAATRAADRQLTPRDAARADLPRAGAAKVLRDVPAFAPGDRAGAAARWRLCWVRRTSRHCSASWQTAA
jgi:hypothetical protein